MVRGSMLIGDDILLAKLQIEEEKMNHNVAEALRKAGGEIMRVALPKTPVKTGEMEKRSFNEGPLLKKGVYTQAVGFEKFSPGSNEMLPYGLKNPKARGVSYAVPLHEDMAATHTNGEAKFLEKAVNETSSKLGKYLQRELKRAYL